MGFNENCDVGESGLAEPKSEETMNGSGEDEPELEDGNDDVACDCDKGGECAFSGDSLRDCDPEAGEENSSEE